MDTKEDKTTKPAEEVVKETKIPEQLTSLVIRHEDEIREVGSREAKIAEFIDTQGKKKTGNSRLNLFFKNVSDKEYVIVGVVAIAITSMFIIPDPTNILMSVISGLFGLGTGRAMAPKDDKDDE